MCRTASLSASLSECGSGWVPMASGLDSASALGADAAPPSVTVRPRQAREETAVLLAQGSGPERGETPPAPCGHTEFWSPRLHWPGTSSRGPLGRCRRGCPQPGCSHLAAWETVSGDFPRILLLGVGSLLRHMKHPKQKDLLHKYGVNVPS